MRKALILIINILLIAEIGCCLYIRQQGKGTANYQRLLEQPKDSFPAQTGEKIRVLSQRRTYVIEIKEKPQQSDPSGGSSSGSGGGGGGSSSGSSSGSAQERTPHFTDAKSMLSLINAERERNGMNKLSWDDELFQACRIRCPELQQKFSHTRPDGSPGKSAYPKYRSYPTGENISVIGYWDSNAVRDFYTGFCNSTAHYFNMIQQPYTHIGIAVYYADNGKVYCCMLLAEKN